MAAARFSANPAAVRSLAGDLNQIRNELLGLAGTLDASDDALGSGRVDQALERLHRDSSDARDKLDKLLERASGMLTSLVDGAAGVDSALADSLTAEPNS